METKLFRISVISCKQSIPIQSLALAFLRLCARYSEFFGCRFATQLVQANSFVVSASRFRLTSEGWV